MHVNLAETANPAKPQAVQVAGLKAGERWRHKSLRIDAGPNTDRRKDGGGISRREDDHHESTGRLAKIFPASANNS
ncbi:MAG: hypothetical protein R3C01_13865 [Planctomycetaceae bacterium]